jgi:hypothetical protein
MPPVNKKKTAEQLRSFQQVDEVAGFSYMDTIANGHIMKLKCYVMHDGPNLNGSSFSLDSMEKLKSTLEYKPVMGYISQKTGDFKGHEEKVTIEDGEVTYEYIGAQYGFIPSKEHMNAQFETKVGYDGVERTYLTCDTYINIKKHPQVLEIFSKSDFVKHQSMELSSMDGTYGDDWLYHVTDAELEALCILGDDVRPAMIGGAIGSFSVDSQKSFVKEMMEDLDSYFSSKDETEEERVELEPEVEVEDEFAKKEEEEEVADVVDEDLSSDEDEDDDGNEEGYHEANDNSEEPEPEAAEDDFSTENEETEIEPESETEVEDEFSEGENEEGPESKLAEFALTVASLETKLTELQVKFDEQVELNTNLNQKLIKYKEAEKKVEFDAKVSEFATKFSLTDAEVALVSSKFEAIEVEDLRKEVGLIVLDRIQSGVVITQPEAKRSRATSFSYNPLSKKADKGTVSNDRYGGVLKPIK